MSGDRFKGKTNGGRPPTFTQSPLEQLRARLTGQTQDLYKPQPTPQPDVDQLGRATATPEQVARAIHGRREPFAEPSSPLPSEPPVEGRKKESSNRSKKQHHPGSQGGPGKDVYADGHRPYTGGPRGRGR